MCTGKPGAAHRPAPAFHLPLHWCSCRSWGRSFPSSPRGNSSAPQPTVHTAERPGHGHLAATPFAAASRLSARSGAEPLGRTTAPRALPFGPCSADRGQGAEQGLQHASSPGWPGGWPRSPSPLAVPAELRRGREASCLRVSTTDFCYRTGGCRVLPFKESTEGPVRERRAAGQGPVCTRCSRVRSLVGPAADSRSREGSAHPQYRVSPLAPPRQGSELLAQLTTRGTPASPFPPAGQQTWPRSASKGRHRAVATPSPSLLSPRTPAPGPLPASAGRL